MSETKAEGFVRNAAGHVQDAVGGLTGDAATQVRGKINQAAGRAQQTYGNAVDQVLDYTSDRPGTALAAALGVGVLVGLALRRR
jgi:uncharacterized protein YjbJ (UPF0337 family)